MTIPSTCDITVSPVWVGIGLSVVAQVVGLAVWIGRQMFPSKSDLQAAKDECRERHAENRASVEALDKMLRAEFASQIETSNRAVMAEFRALSGKVEKLLIRTAVLQDRASHSDDDDTRFPV